MISTSPMLATTTSSSTWTVASRAQISASTHTQATNAHRFITTDIARFCDSVSSSVNPSRGSLTAQALVQRQQAHTRSYPIQHSTRSQHRYSRQYRSRRLLCNHRLHPARCHAGVRQAGRRRGQARGRLPWCPHSSDHQRRGDRLLQRRIAREQHPVAGVFAANSPHQLDLQGA